MNLKQNNLEESTTDLGFVRTINENKGETIVALQKEVTLEDGTVVNVESITPSKMKQVLNSMVDGNEGVITYETPGEPYIERDGVVQVYNDSVIAPELVSLEVLQLPDKTTYESSELLDFTGMKIKATYSNGTVDNDFTDYDTEPSEGEPAENVISFGREPMILIYKDTEKSRISTSFEIVVNEGLKLESLEILQLPNKTVYNVDEPLDLTGLQVKATYNDGTVDDNYTNYATDPDEGYEFSVFDSSPHTITVYDKDLSIIGPYVDFNITINNEETT